MKLKSFVFILSVLMFLVVNKNVLAQRRDAASGLNAGNRNPRTVDTTSSVSPTKTPSESSTVGSETAAVSTGTKVGGIETTIEVSAEPEVFPHVIAPLVVTQQEVLASAGTWGDFSRYLEVLPGVAWNTDLNNEIMVRGGNPAENLYVVDGIEVPNINHFALEGTTGGFTPMLGTSTIRSVEMAAGAYDPSYSSRLSSLIEVHTREMHPGALNREIEVGVTGAGATLLRRIGDKGSLQISAHRSILNLVTNDIGMNGVPVYTNGLATLEWSRGQRDHFRALSLSGADSIDITPDPCDGGVTLGLQTQYRGWRSTEGLLWQHTHDPNTLSTFTADYSEQNQSIGQQEQSTDYVNDWTACVQHPYQTESLYSEHTIDRIVALKYGLEKSHQRWTYSTGITGQLMELDYAVRQPLGEQSPFNPLPGLTNADSFARKLLLGQPAEYAEASGPIGKLLNLMVGVRDEKFALSGMHAFEPRSAVAIRITERQSLNATYTRAAQVVPAIDVLSYPGNANLRPMRADQYSVGADLWRTDWMKLSLQAYRKHYSNEPISTQYPGLMSANMVNLLGQQFVWLPLRTGGWGRAEGLELLLRAHAADRLQVLGSLTYSRTRYAAADGVLRPGNFDFPLMGNGMVTMRLPTKIEMAIRDSYATGRPYTPFDIVLSEEQDRGIYDLNRVNALRGPAYNRIDVDANRNFRIRGGLLNLHGGIENLLRRQNFLGYAWESNCGQDVGSYCGRNVNAVPGIPETEETQMPLLPSGGIKYSF